MTFAFSLLFWFVSFADIFVFQQEYNREDEGGESTEEDEADELRAFQLCLLGAASDTTTSRRRRKRGGGASGSRRRNKQPTSSATCPSPTISDPPTPTPATQQEEREEEWDLPTPLPADFRRDVLPVGGALEGLLDYMSKVQVFQGDVQVKNKTKSNKRLYLYV